MSNNNAGKIEGKWLLKAIGAVDTSQAAVAAKMGKRRDFFQKHISGETYLNAESLADLARAYPKLNIRYILTGEGSPLL